MIDAFSFSIRIEYLSKDVSIFIHALTIADTVTTAVFKVP